MLVVFLGIKRSSSIRRRSVKGVTSLLSSWRMITNIQSVENAGEGFLGQRWSGDTDLCFANHLIMKV